MFAITVAAIAYLLVGAIVGLAHPDLFRWLLVDIKNADLGRAGVFWKPILALLFLILISLLWPIAWFKAKKREQVLAARLERLRPFAQVYAAANSRVRYTGGDGSSFKNAVVILGANMLSGVRAEYDYIQQRYPGYELRKQSLKEHEGRGFDVIHFVTAAGDESVIYFDISAFHAKPPETTYPAPSQRKR